jgi:hypothetical protein
VPLHLGDEFADGIHRLFAAIRRYEGSRGLPPVGLLTGCHDLRKFAKLVRDKLPQSGQLRLLDVIIDGEGGNVRDVLVDDRA